MKTGKPWREKLDQLLGRQDRSHTAGHGETAGPRHHPDTQCHQSQIREHLAREAGADHACPIATGIFIRIAAEAAAEEERAGKLRITPYWRVVREDGSLIEKLPGGPDGQAVRLRRPPCPPLTPIRGG